MVIHLGLHNTASGSFQAYLAGRTAWLRERGWIYPFSGRSRRYAPAHHNIAWALRGDPRFTPRDGTVAGLRRELAGHAGHAIVSSEDFTMAVLDRSVLVDFVRSMQADGFAVAVLLFLRDQASLAINTYKMFLKCGYDVDFGTFLSGVCDRGEARFLQWVIPYRYDRLIARLEELTPDVRVCSYDDARRRGTMLSTFLAACAIDQDPGGEAALPTVDGDMSLRESLRRFRLNAGLAWGALAEPSLTASYRDHELARLQACFGESNAAVCARWGIVLDPLGSPGGAAGEPSTSCDTAASWSDVFRLDFRREEASVAVVDSTSAEQAVAPATRIHGSGSSRAGAWLRRLARPWRQAKKRIGQRRVIQDWDRLVDRLRGQRRPGTRALKRLAILPPYPEHVFGSKGDEAMLVAAVEALHASVPDLEVGVLLKGTCIDAGAIMERGWRVLPFSRFTLADLVRSLDAFTADGCLVIGADMMDGFYDPAKSTLSLAVADLAARRGMTTVISGFSFNATPVPSLRDAFDRLDPEVFLNLRDPVSLARFRSFSRSPARLVADVAFLLRPADSASRARLVRAWVGERARAGDLVLGVNVHPALAAEAGAPSLTRLIDTVAEALQSLLQARGLSVVLLSHDHRDDIAVGDDACLAEIETRLRRRAPDRICRPTWRMTASEAKAIVGALDGVLTGRMHLAIASLGMGVPVAAIAYQGKFEGLFGMLDVPSELLADADVLGSPDRLVSLLDSLLDDLASHRDRLCRTVGSVLHSASANLDPFLQVAGSSGDDRAAYKDAKVGWGP